MTAKRKKQKYKQNTLKAQCTVKKPTVFDTIYEHTRMLYKQQQLNGSDLNIGRPNNKKYRNPTFSNDLSWFICHAIISNNSFGT